MKTCIACAHFTLNASWSGTDVTPGSPGSADCAKKHFSVGEDELVDVCLTNAQQCPDFQLSALARSKGWPD